MNFYHLKLDLYPSDSHADRPLSTTTTTATIEETTTHSSSTATKTTDKTTPTKTHLGPAQELTARFQTLFSPFPQQTRQQPILQSTSSSSSSTKTKSRQDALSSTGLNLPHPEDYRFGPILVASLDQSTASTSGLKEKSNITTTTTNTKNRPSKNKKMTPSTTTSTTTASDPPSAGFKESEPAQGILRLYKDTNEITTGEITTTTTTATTSQEPTSYSSVLSPGATNTTAPATATTTTVTGGGGGGGGTHEHGTQIIQPDQGTAVCVLAVPSYLSPGDFLNFVGPVRPNVSHFRIIRDSVPNRFMVLMKFRTKEATAEFYARYNGKAFSSLEPEICHVVYLKSIEIRAGSMPPYAFPFLNDDPFLQSHHTPTTPGGTTLEAEGSHHQHSHTNNNSNSLLMSSLHSDHGLAELPTCPVCLERMDSSVTGLLTILCQHTFHCHCLSKWGEGSCPICRYSQKSIIKTSNSGTGGLSATTDGISEDQNVCAICGTTENLWICLICGHIGCGRYQEKHAYHHYYETSHLYALELESQRVWDYAGDGYVHRLIQNKADGKLVELPSAVDGTVSNQHSVQVGQEKLDAIGLEYTYLLTSQLESQRLYFDAQMAAMTAQLAQLNKEAKDWEQEAALMNQKNRELAILTETLEKEKMPMLIKEKKTAEKRMEKLQERLQVLERQYEEEKEMNVGLMTNQESIRTKLQEKEAEILELQDQVRDMMIYLDTQQKVEASPIKDELVSGTVGVVVQQGSSNSLPSGNHSRRKGRK